MWNTSPRNLFFGNLTKITFEVVVNGQPATYTIDGRVVITDMSMSADSFDVTTLEGRDEHIFPNQTYEMTIRFGPGAMRVEQPAEQSTAPRITKTSPIEPPQSLFDIVLESLPDRYRENGVSGTDEVGHSISD